MRTRVTGHSQIRRGATNHVYKVETADGAVILKLFRSKDWPEPGKLEWIEQRLREENIPHARTLYYSGGDDTFSAGYVLYEYLAGEQPENLINDKQLTVEAFYEQLGSLLSRVHRIKVRRYGYVSRGAGSHRDFVKHRLGEGHDDVDMLCRTEGEDQTLYLRARAKVAESLRPLGRHYAPVLTHGDPNPKNCIWLKSGQPVLVDWDNAAASLWIRDYAHVTYLSLKRAHQDAVGEYMCEVRDAFFKGYGEIDFSFDDLARIEKAWHIISAHNSLPYLCRSRPEDFMRTRNYLLSLLA